MIFQDPMSGACIREGTFYGSRNAGDSKCRTSLIRNRYWMKLVVINRICWSYPLSYL